MGNILGNQWSHQENDLSDDQRSQHSLNVKYEKAANATNANNPTTDAKQPKILRRKLSDLINIRTNITDYTRVTGVDSATPICKRIISSQFDPRSPSNEIIRFVLWFFTFILHLFERYVNLNRFYQRTPIVIEEKNPRFGKKSASS